MFKILDGRECFWQWDANRYLIVGDVVDEVHFCNRTGDCSLVVKVEQGGLAKVPNILLQTAWPISVYGYDKEYTKHSAVFKVKPRSKPEGYVYTEDEIQVWSELEQRVIELEENGVSAEVINQKIEEYFAANPIPECDLTGYATEDYVDNAVSNVKVDLTGYATEQYVQDQIEAIPEVDLKDYALKSELPDVSGFITEIPEEYVTEEQVIALIEEHGGGGSLPASEEAEF